MSLRDWLPWERARRTAELAAELRAHLEMAEADRIARGESPRDAAANAKREFGNPGLVQEISRDEWGGPARAFEGLTQDLRFALRVLRRSPGFTAVAALTVALAIAATTAIFSVVDATLLRPLPYPRAEQLVRIEDDLRGPGAMDIGMSTPEWRDLQRSGVFDFVSPTWFDNNNLTGLSQTQRASITITATNYLALLGVTPALGVGFDPADATPGFNGQIVISDGLWRRAFGGDERAIGRVVQLDSDSYRIVGVLPAGFQAPSPVSEQRATDVLVAFGFAGAPLRPSASTSRSPLFPGAIARIKRGMDVAEAQRRVDQLVASLRQSYPADYPARSDWHVRLVPLGRYVVGDVRESLIYLFGAVGLLLLIAGANVANLVLLRATARTRELAVRQALGGGSLRLTRQLLTESVVLSMLGGVSGVLLLLATRPWLMRLVPDDVPRLNAISIDWGVLAFAFAVTIAIGAAFGLAPALGARRIQLATALKDEGRGTTTSREKRRTRRLLVVGELALSIVLMVAATLLLRSFRELMRAPLGFDANQVSVIRTRLPYPNDPREDRYGSVANEARFVQEVIRRTAALPGVEAVAAGSGGAVPLDHPEQDQTFANLRFEGHDAEEAPTRVPWSVVTPEYFGLLRLSLLRGRLFDESDTDSTNSVAVVNEAMARAYWPGDEPIGKRIRLSPRAESWTTVVGVVADARTESLRTTETPQLYVSLYQRQGKHLAILVRGAAKPGSIARDVRTIVQSINPALPVFGESVLTETVANTLAARRLAMELIALFALAALALAALGIYGVMSYTVNERLHEFGVRMALGGVPADILRLVLLHAVKLAAAGAAIGLVGALLVSRALAGVLYGVSPLDPLTFGSVAILLMLVGLVSCYLPARRATRIDPIEAMR